jgi:hypothetical protein
MDASNPNTFDGVPIGTMAASMLLACAPGTLFPSISTTSPLSAATNVTNERSVRSSIHTLEVDTDDAGNPCHIDTSHAPKLLVAKLDEHRETGVDGTSTDGQDARVMPSPFPLLFLVARHARRTSANLITGALTLDERIGPMDFRYYV